MVVTGDPSQTDLNRRSDSGLLRSIKILSDIEGVEVINFGQDDIVRDEMVTKNYKRLRTPMMIKLGIYLIKKIIR